MLPRSSCIDDVIFMFTRCRCLQACYNDQVLKGKQGTILITSGLYMYRTINCCKRPSKIEQTIDGVKNLAFFSFWFVHAWCITPLSSCKLLDVLCIFV